MFMSRMADTPALPPLPKAMPRRLSRRLITKTITRSHYCAIYAVNALLSGAQVAAAPLIPTPAAAAIADVSIATAGIRTEVRRPAFHSRAPPIS